MIFCKITKKFLKKYKKRLTTNNFDAIIRTQTIINEHYQT